LLVLTIFLISSISIILLYYIFDSLPKKIRKMVEVIAIPITLIAVASGMAMYFLLLMSAADIHP